MSIRLMHLADIHLGASLTHLGNRSAQRAKDLESAFQRAVLQAPEKHIDAILISGDLFDHFDPSPPLIERVKGIFEKVACHGIPILLIPGTHDSQRYSRCVYLRERFPGVDILLDGKKPVRKLLKEQVTYFYGFSGSDSGQSASAPFQRGDGEGLHVALIHGTVAENAQWGTSARDFLISRDDIEKSGFHYVALGHHHNYKEFRLARASAVYPGTLEGLKFGEDGDRYLVTCEIDGNSVSIEKTRHNQRNIIEVRLDLGVGGIDSNETLAAAIKAHAGPSTIARIILSGSSDFLPAAREVEARLAGDFFYLQIEDETSVYDSALIQSVQNEQTVRGIFTRKMLEKIRQAPAEKKAPLELALRLAIEQFRQVNDETQGSLS